MLVRRRLLDRLGERWSATVTVLVAPAGYGKTTLLTQAVAASVAATNAYPRVAGTGGRIHHWYACGPGAALASTLAEGLRRAVGAGGASCGVDEDAAAVTDALWRLAPRPVALVIDDVHRVAEGSESARLLAAVVEGLPANAHLVLAGRVPPPVPLARLDLAGRVLHLDAADLAFTDDEVDEFARLRGVLRASVDGLGGWPAMAELSASARRGAPAEYVGQEVLAAMSPGARRDLAVLAHLEPFDDELAGAALGRPVDVAALVAGVPLVATTPTGDHSVHALWRSLLDGEVAPAELAAARRRAARAQLGRGEADAAVRLLVDAEAWDDVGDAVVEVFGAGFRPVSRDVLVAWAKRLPAAARARPAGRLLGAVVMVDADPDGAGVAFEECAATFRAAGQSAGELACLVQLGQLAWWREDTDRLADLLARTLELEASGCEGAVPLACVGRALLADADDDSHAMLAELDRIPPDSVDGVWFGLVTWLRAAAMLQVGDARGAVGTADEALARPGGVHVALLAESTRLAALRLDGRAPDALDALPGLVERIDRSGYRNHAAIVAAQAAVALALDGQVEGAATHHTRARALAGGGDAILVGSNLALAEAAMAAAAGEDGAAAATVSNFLARHPLGAGLAATPQRRHLALVYVLAPETRPAWDAADLGFSFRVGRELARGLVAVRATGRLPADAPVLPAGAVVASHLPRPWAAQLALGAIAAGRDDGWRLLDESWPAAHPAVATLSALPGRAAGPVRKAARVALGRLAVPPTSVVALRLLGPVELTRDGAEVHAPDWRRERVRTLLAHLAVHGTSRREQVGDDLWPALDAEAQSRNLRVTLTYLLRVLEPDRPQRNASFHLRQVGGSIALHPGDWLTVDLWDFDDACAAFAEAERRGEPGAALDHARRAVGLWRGEPTELASEEWARAPLERRRQRLAAVATRAGELLLARRRVDEAQDLADRALAVDPFSEPAHRLTIAIHRDAADNLAARRALSRYEEAVHDLGLPPAEARIMVARLAATLDS